MAYKRIKSSGGETAPTMVGSRKPEIFQPIGGALPAMGKRMTKREARRAGKQAKLDHKRAFDAGQMKTANELTNRMKQLKELY
jgi:hypothetical protein